LDVSVDAATRVSTQQMSTRRNVGFTAGYDAPELSETGATTMTDVFAFGKLLLTRDLVDFSPDRNSLARAMTALRAVQRPSARDALKDFFFQEVFAEMPKELQTCIVCFARRETAQGAVCGHSHYTCGTCLSSYVQCELQLTMSSSDSLATHRARGGKIACPACKHTAAREPQDAQRYLSEQQLSQFLKAATFDSYQAARDEATEHRIWEQHQELFMQAVRNLERQFAEQRLTQLAVENTNATQEHLRRHYPNAMQCPTCGVGPVLPEGCMDLQAHHGERRGTRGFISNACSGCGFFARDRNAWARWDGRLA